MKSRKEMQTRKIYLNPPGSLKKSRIGKLWLVNSGWFQIFFRSFWNSMIRHIYSIFLKFIFEILNEVVFLDNYMDSLWTGTTAYASLRESCD